MNKHFLKKLWALIAVPGLAVTGLLLMLLLLGRGPVESALGGMDCPAGGSPVCDTLTDPMERDLCHFVTGVYSEGLLTNWRNPGMEGHFDHAPMRDYGEDQPAISESASMLALYAALIGDQATFDYLFDVSAPAEIGGTGAPMSSTQESPYYFASPNLCLLHWILDKDGYKKLDNDWLANAAGEENRWLEALSIADRKFSDPKYRLFANCLAWGLIGATDFNAGAIGNFEDPGTPEAFDDYLLRPYFGWRDDFSDFTPGHFANLSYNNLMGWRYAAQLGQESHLLYQTTGGVGGIEIITIPLQAISSIRIDMTQPVTNAGYSLYEVEAYNPFTDTNLLLHADCTASSSETEMLACEKALDGNLYTYWSSEQPVDGQLDPQWLVITPTQPGRVMTITLHWAVTPASSYNLSASWPFADFYSNVLSYTTPLMADSIQHCGTDLPRVMYDIERHFYYGEILTPNLACLAPLTPTVSSTKAEGCVEPYRAISCTASSNQDDLNCPACTCERAFDNDPSTRWASDWNDDEWIALEFKEPEMIDGVVLRWEAAYGMTYTIDVSDDGLTWTSVYTETDGDGGKDEIHFPLTTARYIRMHGIERGTGYGYSLWEFEVYRGGTSSLTALDLARRAAAYAKVSGDVALWEVGRHIFDWYKARYPSCIAAAYDPCTGDPLPGWENGEWASIMANLAELAAEYGDCHFARQVIEEKLSPFNGIVGPSAFENLEVLLALRHMDERCWSVYEWEQLSPHGPSPPEKAGHTAVYDEANQQMVTFGGCCFITDTHVLDLTSGNENWEQLFPPGLSPWLEGGHTAVYDTDNGRMIVWGGKHATTDTYALDLTPCNEKWVTLTVTGTLPEGRMGHSAIYDAANKRMIVFAGYFGEYPYFRNDVWALCLPLGEERWEVIFPLDPPPNPVPPLRAGHTAIYDAANQRMIVFGGFDIYWKTLNDVWALHLTPGEEKWEQIFPSGSSPAPRVDPTAIYDPDNERMVVFGGYDGHNYLNDVWALDLTPGHEEWHEIFPSGTSPAKRSIHSAIYDAANERMVIFGGEDSDSYFNDVWALNGPPMMVPRIDKMGPASVTSGATFTYTVTYENASPVTVTLSITDTLPPEVTYVGSTPPGTWVSATNVVSWTIPSQAPGISGTIVLTVTAPFTLCTRLVNRVEMVTDPPTVLADDVWATRVGVGYCVYLPLILKDYD